MNMIEVQNLTKKFGEVTAVENLTFEVAEGEIFGLLGPNGAGKTTTVRMLCCLISRTGGDARIAGYQARALIHDPQLLFFDEPTANLDPESSRMVRDFILQLKKDGKTVFLNTHNLDEAQRICDRIGILKTKLLTVNTPEQLARTVWGSKTVIQVQEIDDRILAAIRNLEPQDLRVEGNKIVLALADPQKENPDFIQAIVAVGGRIQYVTQLNPGLEETYIKIMEETK